MPGEHEWLRQGGRHLKLPWRILSMDGVPNLEASWVARPHGSVARCFSQLRY